MSPILIVSRDVVVALSVGCARLSTARMRATSSRGVKGFGKVIVGADFEADNPIDVVAACRQHQHGNTRTRANPAQYVEAVGPGKHDVRTTRSCSSDNARSMPRSPLWIASTITFGLEVLSDQFAKTDVVVNYKTVPLVAARFKTHLHDLKDIRALTT